MGPRCCVFVTCLGFLAVAIFANAQDCQVPAGAISLRAPAAVIHGTDGSTVVHAANPQSSAAKLKLSAGPFVSQASQSLAAGTVAFAPAGGGELPDSLAPGSSLDVLAKVSGEGAPGLSSARLFNAGECIGKLEAVKYDVPLNITVEGDGAGTAALLVQAGQAATLTLKNNDDLTYPVSLALSFEGRELAPVGPIVFGPNASQIVQFTPSGDWFDSRGWIRPFSTKAQLVIRLAPVASVAAASVATGQALNQQLAPIRPISLNVQLATFTSQQYQVLQFVVVFFTLLLGGLASLALNSALPTILKRLDYRKQLQIVADATSTVSTRVDSQLRVLLRLERNRLAKLLESIGLFGGNTADIFQQVSVGLTALTKRLEVAQRLDDLRSRFDSGSASWPPSVCDNIDNHLQAAADALRSLFVSEKNIDAASAALGAAEAALNALNDPDAQAKQIAARHQELLAEAATFKPEDFTAMKNALPGIFWVLAQTYDDNHPVLPSNLVQVDDSIARMHVVLDYVYIRGTTTDATIDARLDKHLPDLIKLLGTRDWRSLQDARDLVLQMRENVYVEDLLDELAKKKADITTDQQVARPYLPVEFSISFHHAAYNHAQALQQLTCDWSFGDKLKEKGWAICHFFQDSGVQKLSASVPFPEGMQPDSAEFPKELAVRERSRSLTESTWFAEGLRFLIAFFIALIGLVAGAQDQLAKLDILPAIIAVFLLGFGADSIKNLLAQPASSPAK